ncbi:benzoate/H(+) symporter BenE family transporter [Thermococcus sp. LS2]|uniref:benzoate/H(+) symporter BenE family transporter n=1 Tax=Thermococcus sp. LS2 TaxID=1638260 RepID=UPI00143AF2FA|nr:benzoate/H(+) symporter BenE family transporter [Thermococcus sp. LS2]NJE13163.1 benzoate/H(+) symporter BenE family transporter [Thermococcus sp. LS2]
MVSIKQWLNTVWEPGVGFKESLKDLPKSTTVSTVGIGLSAALFGCSGPALIIYESGKQAGWSDAQIASWIFAVYFFGALLGIVLSLRWKKPMSGAWTIPGAAMLGATLGYFSPEEAAGAYFIAGLIVLLIGLSGQLSKLIRSIPMPIMMGMITGVLLRFGIGMIKYLTSSPTVILPALIAVLIVEGFRHRGKLKWLPGPIVGIIIGFIIAYFTGDLNLSGLHFELAHPIVYMPKFSWSAMLSISIPLALMVLFAENVQAIGILIAQGYDKIPKNTPVPINGIAILSGIGGMVTSFFGGHNANIAGPMTAMCSSEEAHEDPEKRYAASFWNGVFFGSFGLIAPAAVAFINAMPRALISFIAGITMVGVLLRGFHGAFGVEAKGKFQWGAFFAFVTGASGITIFKIGAPFWALVIGSLVSLIVEYDDWKTLRQKAIQDQ